MDGSETWVFDPATMKLAASYPVYSYSAAITPDRTKLVTTDGKAAIVWDAKTKKRLVTWKLDNNGHGEVTISPDGRRVSATTFSAILYLWDLATQKQIAATGVGDTEHGNPAVFSPDGSFVGLVSYHSVFVRDGKTGAPVWNQEMHAPGKPSTGDAMQEIAIGIGADGVRVVGEDDGHWYVEQLALATGKPAPLAKRNCR
jgi:DNA-binding beta-propeller fold protein YncE